MKEPCCSTTEKKSSCCEKPEANKTWAITSNWTAIDHLGAILVRLFNHSRNNYRVTPGLYALNNPTPDSPVFVTANYKLSFDHLRRALTGISGSLLVLNTQGINVWCAAGKGSFGTIELGKQIVATKLSEKVTHRTLILPQLGAPNLRAHEIKAFTGFTVKYGPIRACDLPHYLKNGNKATPEMRRVRFPLMDRLILTPMELSLGFKYLLYSMVILFLLFGLSEQPFSFVHAKNHIAPYFLIALTGFLSGAFVSPLLLPIIPVRSFALKGVAVGLLSAAVIFLSQPLLFSTPLLTALLFLFAPTLSSFMMLNFTGSSTFTSPSGVKKEMKRAIPVYIGLSAISLVLLILSIIKTWGNP